MAKKTKEQIEAIVSHVTKTTVETVGGYPVKNLEWKGGNRNYFSGLVKNPKRASHAIHEGYTACAWEISGRAKPQTCHSNKNDVSLNLKIEPQN